VSDANTDILNVVLTMDVLPAVSGGDVRGPQRWDHAERAVRAFAETAQGEGLAAEGCELGLLCHPQLSGYQACLGSYSFDRQREIVSLDRKSWEDTLGEEPATFRSGFFSANDYTFHVLCMEGFRQGSCSLPGRMDNEQCSLWFPSYPFPHHTDPLDRSAPGSMEFFEVPVTSDFEAATHISYETYTPPHLRVEEPDVHSYARDLIERQLARMLEDRVDLKAVTLVTSNVAAWGAEDDPHVERLQNLCAMLREVAGEHGMELRPLTIAALHEEADAIFRRVHELEEGQ